jgi:hypothetical protein
MTGLYQVESVTSDASAAKRSTIVRLRRLIHAGEPDDRLYNITLSGAFDFHDYPVGRYEISIKLVKEAI